jgi:hypothetical protein
MPVLHKTPTPDREAGEAWGGDVQNGTNKVRRIERMGDVENNLRELKMNKMAEAPPTVSPAYCGG